MSGDLAIQATYAELWLWRYADAPTIYLAYLGFLALCRIVSEQAHERAARG